MGRQVGMLVWVPGLLAWAGLAEAGPKSAVLCSQGQGSTSPEQRVWAHLEGLWDDDACSRKHGPSCMEELVCPVLLHLCRLLPEAQGVVAVAAAQSYVRCCMLTSTTMP